MWKQYKEIITSPLYLATVIFVSLLVLLLSVWLPNLGLFWSMMRSTVPLLEKILFLWNSLGALGTNFSVLSATLTVVIAILMGLNIALVVLYFKKRSVFQNASGVGIFGMLTGFIGVGCASCGSVILSLLIGVGGVATLSAYLPLGGAEFSIISIIMLSITFYVISKKVSRPAVCEIKLKG